MVYPIQSRKNRGPAPRWSMPHLQSILFSLTTKPPLLLRPSFPGLRNANHPNIVGRCHKCVPPQKTHRSTFHASRVSRVSQGWTVSLLGNLVTVYRFCRASFCTFFFVLVLPLSIQYFPFYLISLTIERRLISLIFAPCTRCHALRNDSVNFFFIFDTPFFSSSSPRGTDGRRAPVTVVLFTLHPPLALFVEYLFLLP
jgi:hypothetical protein